jgi:hypothetical protein
VVAVTGEVSAATHDMHTPGGTLISDDGAPGFQDGQAT